MNAQSQSWLGSITAAIRTLMQLLTALFSTASRGAQMLDDVVVSYQEHLAVDLEVADHDYATRSVDLATAALVKQREEIQNYLAQDTTNKRRESYDACHKEIKEAVEARLAKLRAQRSQRQ